MVRHIENSSPLFPSPLPREGRVRVDWFDDSIHAWNFAFLARDRLLKAQESDGIGIEKWLFDFP